MGFVGGSSVAGLRECFVVDPSPRANPYSSRPIYHAVGETAAKLRRQQSKRSYEHRSAILSLILRVSRLQIVYLRDQSTRNTADHTKSVLEAFH